MASDAHLFAPATATRSRMGHTKRRRNAVAENPPDGAILYYYLKEEPKEPLKLEILDSSGKAIRTLTSEEKKKEEDAAEAEFDRDDPEDHIPAKTGLNVFAWDLRYQEPTKVPKAVYDEGEPAGPLVMPGKYQVRLTAGGKSGTQPIEIVMDPRVKTSTGDLQLQFDMMLKLRDRQEELNKAILGIRDLRAQLLGLEKRLGTPTEEKVGANKALVDQSVAIRKKITAIEEELIDVNAKASEDELNYPTKLNSKFGYLGNAVDSADAKPTEGEIGVYAELDPQLEVQLAKWREVTAKDVPALNDALRSANTPLVAIR
jgi:hypothetical protein